MTSPLQVRDDVIGRQLALHVSIVERSLTSALLFVCQQFALLFMLSWILKFVVLIFITISEFHQLHIIVKFGLFASPVTIKSF